MRDALLGLGIDITKASEMWCSTSSYPKKVTSVEFKTLLDISNTLATGGSTVCRWGEGVLTLHIYQHAEHVSSECINKKNIEKILSHSTDIYNWPTQFSLTIKAQCNSGKVNFIKPTK